MNPISIITMQRSQSTFGLPKEFITGSIVWTIMIALFGLSKGIVQKHMQPCVLIGYANPMKKRTCHLA